MSRTSNLINISKISCVRKTKCVWIEERENRSVVRNVNPKARIDDTWTREGKGKINSAIYLVLVLDLVAGGGGRSLILLPTFTRGEFLATGDLLAVFPLFRLYRRGVHLGAVVRLRRRLLHRCTARRASLRRGLLRVVVPAGLRLGVVAGRACADIFLRLAVAPRLGPSTLVLHAEPTHNTTAIESARSAPSAPDSLDDDHSPRPLASFPSSALLRTFPRFLSASPSFTSTARESNKPTNPFPPRRVARSVPLATRKFTLTIGKIARAFGLFISAAAHASSHTCPCWCQHQVQSALAYESERTILGRDFVRMRRHLTDHVIDATRSCHDSP